MLDKPAPTPIAAPAATYATVMPRRSAHTGRLGEEGGRSAPPNGAATCVASATPACAGNVVSAAPQATCCAREGSFCQSTQRAFHSARGVKNRGLQGARQHVGPT